MAKTSEYALQVRMPHSMHRQWAASAKSAGCSLSEWVRRAVEQYRLAVGVTKAVQRAQGTTRQKRPTPPAQSTPRKVRSAKPAKLGSNGPGPRGGDSGRLPAKG